jgi:thiol:disulfide interchange protein
VRINVLSAVGSEAARRYNIVGVPALIVFDGQGSVAFQQVGVPQRARIVAEVQRLY